MDQHYNAFISYNHNPRDIRIAAALQRQLENFRLPKGVANRSGNESIGRVFLDKGELGVTGDLNETILDALKDSDFLIVICSPESRQSVWVEREIEFFLRYHDRNRILTVITDGEPSDVLPEVLLYEEITEEDGSITRVQREPLSCDYRLPMRRARREELPRLVSAILGCHYDDLVQRQKAYRTRRQLTISATATVLLLTAVIYLLWSSGQIKQNYNNTLREQSLNLAVQSEEALASGNRIGAIRYALEALPSKDKDRPVVSEAALALSDALNMYKTRAQQKITAEKQFNTENNFESAYPFQYDGRDYIAVLYDTGLTEIWDCDKGETVFEDYTAGLFASGIRIVTLYLSEDRYLILISDDGILSLDMKTGSEIYRKKISSVFYPSAPSVSIRCAGYDSYCFSGSDLWISGFPEDAFLLFHIDTKSGNVLYEYKLDDTPEVVRVNDDGSKIALLRTHSQYVNDEYYNTITMFDTAAETPAWNVQKPYVSDICFDSEGRLIACGFTEKPDAADGSLYTSLYYNSNNVSQLTTVSKRHTVYVTCLGPESGSELWTSEREDMYNYTPWLEYVKDEGYYRDSVLCATGSKVAVIDRDGTLTGNIDYHSLIIDFYSAKDDLRAVLYNGSFGIYDPRSETLRNMSHMFIEPVVAADKIDGSNRIFIAYDANSINLSDTRLIQYDFSGMDARWADYDLADELSDMDPLTVSPYGEDFAAAACCKSGSESLVHIVRWNTRNGKVVMNEKKKLPGGTEAEDYRYSGFDASTGSAYFANIASSTGSSLLAADVNEGSVKEIPIAFTESASAPSDGRQVLYDSYDLLTGSKYEIIDHCQIYEGMLYFPAVHRRSYSSDGSDESYTIDILSIDPRTGEAEDRAVLNITDPGAEFGNDWSLGFDPVSGNIIFTDNKRGIITCYGSDGRELWSKNDLDYTPDSSGIGSDGTVLVLGKDLKKNHTLVVYSKDGKETVRTSLGYVSTYYKGGNRLKISELSGGESLLSFADNAFIMDISDWKILARIPSEYVSYNPEVKEFMLGDAGNASTLGHVPYRTLDEMIEEGYKTIN